MISKTAYITKEGLKKLREELDELKTVKRKEIAQRIQDAKELGDLSENAEYSEAKEEQAFIEQRIAELEAMIKNVEIISHRKNTTTVQIGSTIRVKDGSKNESTYTIVGSTEADPFKNRISNESPIGQAFLGHQVGERVQVETPSGEMQFEIVAVE